MSDGREEREEREKRREVAERENREGISGGVDPAILRQRREDWQPEQDSWQQPERGGS